MNEQPDRQNKGNAEWQKLGEARAEEPPEKIRLRPEDIFRRHGTDPA